MTGLLFFSRLVLSQASEIRILSRHVFFDSNYKNKCLLEFDSQQLTKFVVARVFVSVSNKYLAHFSSFF